MKLKDVKRAGDCYHLVTICARNNGNGSGAGCLINS